MRSGVREEDLFRGRSAALTAVRQWLTGPVFPGRPLVVTGQWGAGKSAVVARVVVGLEAESHWSGLFFHAESATHEDLLRALSDLVDADRRRDSASALELLVDVEAAGVERPWLLVVDALDEAGTSADREAIARSLRDIAEIANFRVVVSSRPRASGDRFAPDSLFTWLGIDGVDDPALIDLDSDAYFDPAELEDFAEALLVQAGLAEPAPARGAWKAYRADGDLLRRTAHALAEKAQRNYLVAALAAEPLSRQLDPVDPAARGFEEKQIPARISDALRWYFPLREKRRGARQRGLLEALAYARGRGVPEQLWLRFARALGYENATVADLDELHRSAAADLLRLSEGDPSGSMTALSHPALRDALLDGRRDRLGDEQLILGLLWAEEASVGWASLQSYWRLHAAAHAAAAGGYEPLDRLVTAAGFLAVADLPRLMSRLGTREGAAPAMWRVLERAGQRADPLPPGRRLGLLAVTAAHLGLNAEMADLVDARGPAGPAPVWAHRLAAFPHQDLGGHEDYVTSLAIGHIAGKDVIVSGGVDGTVRIWDGRTGRQVGRELWGVEYGVLSVGIIHTGTRDLVVVANGDGLLAACDPSTWEVVWRVRPHESLLRAAVVGRLGGREVVVSTAGLDIRAGTPLPESKSDRTCPATPARCPP